jgi:hypothetical protein
MAQNQKVVTIILPTGEKYYAENVAFVASNVGIDGPPKKGQHVAVMAGNYAIEDVVLAHQQANTMFEKAGQKLIDKMTETEGPDAVLHMLLDRITDEILGHVASQKARQANKSGADILREILKQMQNQ